MRRRSLVALAATAALLATILPGTALAAQPDGVGKAAKFSTDGNYIVQMIDAPVVAYEGGVAGLKATAPGQGKKINPNSADVVKYVGYLNGKHDAALASVGGATKLYDYVYSFNGFAAQLTAAQANKLAAAEGIAAVTPDEMKSLDTSSTPNFLGLTGEDGP